MRKLMVKLILLAVLVTACGQAPASLSTPMASTPSLAYTPTSLPLNTSTPLPTQKISTATAPPGSDNLALITPSNAGDLEKITVLAGHTDRVTDLAFSGDGAYLASTGYDRKILLWDTGTWQQVATFPIREADLNTIAFSPAGSLLACGQTVWDATSGEIVHTLLERVNEPAHVAFSPDGSRVAVDASGKIKVWDVASWQEVLSFTAPVESRWLFGIAFSPDGKWLAAGSGQNGTVYFWSAETGELAFTLEQGNQNDVHDIAFTPDGLLLATGGTDYYARIWDVSSGAELHKMPLIGMYSLAVSPDGSLLATAGPDRAVTLWNVQTGRPVRTLPCADELMAVAFSADGKLLAAGGYDDTIVVWAVLQ